MIIKNTYHKELAFVVLNQPFSIRSKEIRTVDNVIAIELLKNPWIIEHKPEIKKPKVEIPIFKTEKLEKPKIEVERPVIKQVKKNISKVDNDKIKTK